MSTGPLPRQADIRKFTLSGAVLEGEIEVSELDRLSKALAGNTGVIAYSLRFGSNEEGIPVVEGSLRASVQLTCQRCLEPMTAELDSRFMLGVVFSDDKAKLLPDSLEPLVLEDDTVDTRAIVEDEALLLIPVVSYHPEASCNVKAGYVSVDENINLEPEEERENPFKVLESLKKSDT